MNEMRLTLDIVIAHQGWDELLLFGVPVVLAILAVRWAERRSKRRPADEPTDAEFADAHPANDADQSDPDALTP